MKIYNASCSISRTYAQLHALDQSASDIVLSKTCTPLPKDSTPHATVIRDPLFTLNHLGLPNPGIAYYHDVTSCVTSKPFYLSMVPECLDHDVSLFHKLDGVEINVSCPNLHHDPLGYHMTDLRYVVEKALVWKQCKPTLDIGLKLPFYTTSSDLDTVADLCKTYSIDYVVCINTIRGRLENISGGISGGISGPALKPFALYNAYELAKRGINVIGCGGIQTANDVRDFQRAGCIGVQIGTAAMDDLAIFHRIKLGLIQAKL